VLRIMFADRKPGRHSPVKLLGKLLTGYVASLNQTLSNAFNFGPEQGRIARFDG